MKVVHICMHDFGGAGNAAYRLHKGLCEIGVDSTMLVLNKKSKDKTVKVFPEFFADDLSVLLETENYQSENWKMLWERWSKVNNEYPLRPKNLEVFSDIDSSFRLDQFREIQEADVINLHWVAGMLDYSILESLSKTKCVVWTLHDMNAFTGGCHYSVGCTKYYEKCFSCHQLGSADKTDLAYKQWYAKKNIYEKSDITIVTPSKWLGECCKMSSLLGEMDVLTIPYGFPLEIYKPGNVDQLKQKYGININAKLVTFVAEGVGNSRKGFNFLYDALLLPKIKETGLEIVFGVVGGGTVIIDNLASNLKVVKFGLISDPAKIAEIYSMSDMFVIPSLEDNLPNTVVESLACGTPVVGFNIGGIPDMIEDKSTGFLVNEISADALADGIIWVLDNCNSDMKKLCRQVAENKYNLHLQADRYSQLYDRLIAEKSKDSDYSEQNTRAKLLAESGNYDEAIRIFEEIISADSNHFKANFNLGILYYQQKELVKSARSYLKCLEIKPLDRNSTINTFYVLKELGKVNEAQKIVSNYLTENFNDREMLALLEQSEKLFKHEESDTGIENDGRYLTSNDSYKVSAIVSTYNSAEFMHGCMQDLVEQTLFKKGQLEIVVIDSASPQNEKQIVQEFQSKYPNIVYLRTQERETLYAAWNRGIKMAKGKYITNANTDDRHRNDALEVLSDFLDQNEAISLVYADSLITETANETFEKNSAVSCYIFPECSLRQALVRQFFGSHPMWRKSVHDTIGYFNPDFVVSGDYEFFSRLVSKFYGYHINEFLSLYCRRKDSVERANKTINSNEQLKVQQYYRQNSELEMVFPLLSKFGSDLSASEAAMINLGVLSWQNGHDASSSLYYFQKVLEINSESICALFNIALIYRKNNDLVNSLKYQSMFDSVSKKNHIHAQLLTSKSGLSYFNHKLLDITIPIIEGVLEQKYEKDSRFYANKNDIALTHFSIAQSLVNVKLFSEVEKHIDLYRKTIDYDLFEKSDKRAINDPVLSVVIVAYNTKNDLIKCLNSVLPQLKQDTEIIVVDNGKNDEVLEELLCMKILYVRCPININPSEGRNIGAHYAKGEILAFLDDDAIAEQNFVKEILNAFDKYEIHGLRGKILPKNDVRFMKYSSHYNLGDYPFPYYIGTEGNSAFLKKSYMEVGGMHPLIFGAEGAELSYRMYKKYGNSSCIYCPNVIIYHDCANSDQKLNNKLERHKLMDIFIVYMFPGYDSFLKKNRDLYNSLKDKSLLSKQIKYKKCTENNKLDYSIVKPVVVLTDNNQQETKTLYEQQNRQLLNTLQKPRLLFFSGPHEHLYLYSKIALIDTFNKLLDTFFDVKIVSGDCDYAKEVDLFIPDMCLFDTGVDSSIYRPSKITNTDYAPEIPKAGISRQDLQSPNKPQVFDLLDKWGVEVLFSRPFRAQEAPYGWKDKTIYIPLWFDNEIFHDYGEEKIIPIGLIGNGFFTSERYPWRKAITDIVISNFPVFHSPRPFKKVLHPYIGVDYARLLNRSQMAIGDGGVRKAPCFKWLEIPASNTCFVTEETKIVKEFGFVDMQNCLFVDKKNAEEKIRYYLSNSDKLEEITAAGYNFVHKNHALHTKSQIIEWLNLRKILKNDEKIIQTGIFDKLTITNKQQKQVKHISVDESIIHISLSNGYSNLEMGFFEQAKQDFLNIIFHYNDMFEPLLGLGIAELNLGNFENAIKYLGKNINVLNKYNCKVHDPINFSFYIFSLYCLGLKNEAKTIATSYNEINHPLYLAVCKLLGINFTNQEQFRIIKSIFPIKERDSSEWYKYLENILKKITH